MSNSRKNRPSFIFYFDWGSMIFDIADRDSSEEAIKLLRVICQYAETGEDISNSVKLKYEYGIMFNNSIKIYIDDNAIKYRKSCEWRGANGKLGGRPKKDADDRASKPNRLNENLKEPNRLNENPKDFWEDD